MRSPALRPPSGFATAEPGFALTTLGRTAGADLRRAGMEIILDVGADVPITGGCMSPALPPGARVRIERCSAGRLRSGDVVLLEGRDGFVLHRCLATVSAGRRRLLVKSDRARRPDAPWPPRSVMGRVSGVEVDGTVRAYRPGFVDRLRAAALGFFWAGIFPFLREARDSLCPSRDNNGFQQG